MDRFAQICFGIAQTASRLKKVQIAAGYLRILSDDDLQRAVRRKQCVSTRRSNAPIVRGHSN